MDDLLAAQYCIALENTEPCNFSMIPNVIDHLTYDSIDEKTGEIKVKRISVYAKELYRILKSISGQSNLCWMNSDNIAEWANMSKSTVSECKKELQQNFHQLDNTPLIEITEKKKVTKKGDEKINGTHFHQITIKGIWGYNRAYYLLKKIENERGARSPAEHADGHVRQPNTLSQGACSLSERNNIACSNTSLLREQHSTANADSVCPSDKLNAVEDPKTQTFNWLTKNGCNVKKAVDVATKYPVEEIQKAIEYTEKAVEKSKKKMKFLGNPMAYLIKTLENKWWISKTC